MMYLSAPAHDNILLIRSTWKGCSRIRIWKASLPAVFTKYLLQQIRPASRASDESCSYSSDTRWIHSGKSSTFAFFLPKSKIRILASGRKQIVDTIHIYHIPWYFVTDIWICSPFSIHTVSHGSCIDK